MRKAAIAVSLILDLHGDHPGGGSRCGSGPAAAPML